MILVQDMWNRLWDIKIDDFPLLHTTSSNYLTYVGMSEDSIKKALPSIFVKENPMNDIIQYVAWQTLGPFLIKGFHTLYTAHNNDYELFSKKTFPDILSKDVKEWNNAIEHFKPFSDIFRASPKINFEEWFSKIMVEINNKNDVVIAYSYCLGVIMAKSPMGPPECYSSTVNLIKENILTPKNRLRSRQFTMPISPTWITQEEELRKKLDSYT